MWYDDWAGDWAVDLAGMKQARRAVLVDVEKERKKFPKYLGEKMKGYCRVRRGSITNVGTQVT